MGTPLSRLFTHYFQSWVYVPAITRPVSYEAQQNYNTKGEYTGKLDEEMEELDEMHKKSSWKTSARLMNELSEARRLRFRKEYEPHLDHPEPKIDLPDVSEMLFQVWDPDSTAYLRIVFDSLDVINSGVIKKLHVQGFIRSLGGPLTSKKFDEIFDKFDEKRINCLALNDFLKFVYCLDRAILGQRAGRLQRRIKENAKMALHISRMNINEAISSELF